MNRPDGAPMLVFTSRPVLDRPYRRLVRRLPRRGKIAVVQAGTHTDKRNEKGKRAHACTVSTAVAGSLCSNELTVSFLAGGSIDRAARLAHARVVRSRSLNAIRIAPEEKDRS
jgi:hypothetical protein